MMQRGGPMLGMPFPPHMRGGPAPPLPFAPIHPQMMRAPPPNHPMFRPPQQAGFMPPQQAGFVQRPGYQPPMFRPPPGFAPDRR